MSIGEEQNRLKEWKESVEKFFIGDIKRMLDSDELEVGLIILTFVGIDCLGGYFAGRESDTQTFKSFMRSDYFPPSYHNLADEIFELRNGLMHDYTIKHNKFRFYRDEGEGVPHLKSFHQDKKYPISFNRKIFAKDFLNAWKRYSEDVLNHPNLSRKTLDRMNKEGRGYLVVETPDKFPKPGTISYNPDSSDYGGYTGTVSQVDPE
jgi:hypothetical protein